MNGEFPVEGLIVRDVERPTRDGRSVEREKVITFFLGSHGPFTERLPKDATAADINERIDALRGTLRGITT